MPSEKMQIKIDNTLDILCTEYPKLFSKTEPKPIALNFRQKVRDHLKEKYNITNYVLNGTIFRYARESRLYLLNGWSSWHLTRFCTTSSQRGCGRYSGGCIIK